MASDAMACLILSESSIPPSQVMVRTSWKTRTASRPRMSGSVNFVSTWLFFTQHATGDVSCQ